METGGEEEEVGFGALRPNGGPILSRGTKEEAFSFKAARISHSTLYVQGIGAQSHS